MGRREGQLRLLWPQGSSKTFRFGRLTITWGPPQDKFFDEAIRRARLEDLQERLDKAKAANIPALVNNTIGLTH